MSAHSFNLSKLFPSSPAPQDLPLPFAIDEMEFSRWLDSLATSDDMALCHQIFQVLQTLNEKYPPERKLIPGRSRLFFLEKMGTAFLAATAKLTASVTDQDVGLPDTNQDETAKREIAAWGSFELANGYALLTQEGWFKDEQYYSVQEKTSILANGIQAMGRGLLYVSQTYTKPQLHFWGRCFQFYRLAQLYHLLEPEVNPGAEQIDNAFKQVLVFSLTNANQFTPDEMWTIYDYLGQYAKYAGLLKSVPKKKYKGIPSINLKGSGPPIIVDEVSESFNPDILYIATVSVASKILESTSDKRDRSSPGNRLLMLRLAKRLTLNEQRKDQRESAQGTPLGIIGFENLVEYLLSIQGDAQDLNKPEPLPQQAAPRPGEIRDLNFEILVPDAQNPFAPVSKTAVPAAGKSSPSASFRAVEFTDPTDIWHKKRLPNLESSVRLIDRSAKGFGLLWIDTLLKPKVGSIIGILQKTMTIGLIRWMVQSHEDGMFIGVELLGTRATIVNVNNPGLTDQEAKAVYLPGDGTNSQAPSLIILNRQFKPTEFIYIRSNHKNVRFRLVKQLHLTSFINHVEIVRSH